MVRYIRFDSPLGQIFAAQSAKGICRLCLPNEDEHSFLHLLTKHYPEEELVEDPHELRQVIGELMRYFKGQLKQFTFPLDLRTTPFRRRALEEVLRIPYGETASYKDIAERMGHPSAVRAVGGANANNPLPIVIPCHRVIAHDGRLGGYGGRLEWKAWLLELEGAL